MLPEHPAFRRDLITSEVREGGRLSYLVKDPVTNRFFRLKESERFITLQLDGRVSLEEVARRFEERFEIALPRPKLEAFVERLVTLCLVDRGLRPEEIARVQRSASAIGSGPWRILFVKLRAVDPDSLFDALAPRLRFFFTRGFAAVYAAAAVGAIAIAAANRGEYAEQAVRLLRPGTIATVIVMVFLVTVLHECAHGLTCKHYGGHVHEMGFLLIYFMPAFYCNVSDAWLFPSKRERIWVSFAGVYFQIFLWALAVIVWRLLDQETWPSDACAVLMATSGLSTLFSLNPLIKLDGYYMLADYLEIPNLRKRAFGFLGSRIKRIWASSRSPLAPVTRREWVVYVTYGVIAGLYSLVLLLFIFAKAAGAIVSRFHGAGILVLSAAVALVGTGALGTWVSKRRRSRAEGERRRMKRGRFWGTVGAVAAVIVILALAKWELKVTGTFKLFPEERSSVRAEVAGVLSAISVDEGDTVRAGQEIARIDDREYRSQLGEADADAAKWRAELDLLRRGPLRDEIARLEQAVERARTKVGYAERELARVEELHRGSLVPANEYEKAEQELSLNKKDQESAESELRVLRAGSRPEKIREAEAEIERLDATRAYLFTQIEKAVVRSPIAGVVASHRLRDRMGEHVDAGDEVCQVVGCERLLLEMPVSERDIMEVREGEKVKLKARSIPERSFYGRVVSVPPVAIDSDSRAVLVVTSEVENHGELLKPGMTGTAKIYCGKRPLIDLLTRKIIRFVRVEFWWW